MSGNVKKINKLVAFRLPIEIIKAIEAESEAQGLHKTAVVCQALTQYFNLTEVSSSPFQEMQIRIEELEMKIDGLLETVSSE